jgi:hypothetical protein
MYSAQVIVGMIYRIFLLSLIAAVLWVKGYLWWVFGIAVFLFVLNIFVNLPIGRPRLIDVESDEEDEDDEASDEED